MPKEKELASQEVKDLITPRRDGGVCAACLYPAKTLTQYPMSRNVGNADAPQHKLLCELCAASESSKIYEYPAHYGPGVKPVVSCLMFVANLLLEKLAPRDLTEEL